MYNSSSSPTFFSCIFTKNSVGSFYDGKGGGICNVGNSGHPWDNEKQKMVWVRNFDCARALDTGQASLREAIDDALKGKEVKDAD